MENLSLANDTHNPTSTLPAELDHISADISADNSTKEVDDVHEQVLDLLHAPPLDALELISSDPEYYLNIVNTYSKTEDGKDIYLPDLLNLLARRDNYGRLTIK